MTLRISIAATLTADPVAARPPIAGDFVVGV